MKYKISRTNSDYDISIEISINTELNKMGFDDKEREMLDMLENKVELINAIVEQYLNANT